MSDEELIKGVRLIGKHVSILNKTIQVLTEILQDFNNRIYKLEEKINDDR